MSIRRHSTALFVFALTGAALFVLMLIHANVSSVSMAPQQQARRLLVREYGLSDLCLFTEARYTRHLSAADPNTAFQDHPFSLEHFPSGSLVGPPHDLFARWR